MRARGRIAGSGRNARSGQFAGPARAGLPTRVALAGAALAALLAVSGCTGSDPAPEPTVTVTVTASPTAEPTPTEAPAPDPDAFDPSDQGTWLIDWTGVGPLKLGETLADVEADLPHPPETCRAGVDTYVLGGIAYTAVSGIDESDPSAPVVVVRMLTVDGFDASAAQPRTETGIGLGSTLDELTAAYPELESYEGPRGETVYRLAADGRTINFELLGTNTVQIISVVEGTGVASEYCGA
ncbi:hypothetical protein N1031_16950 [Herbiconiux moechotypicola]|uniref:Lipoprotein n=1 Tax=Herbiconiux moechotypicola TaxID=637393 RepID=A0ABN3DQT7_9MICO|nr:hypothetical protein [Herbiconiux moechotypicola]MCS5731451.1 hypothetical protein [Herbiconiux moechotypicola]